MTDHTTGEQSARFEFAVSDNRADIREVLDATAGPEHIVLSTTDAQATQLQEEMEASGADDLWTALTADPAWTVYQPPLLGKPVTFARESADVRDDARGAHLDEALITALDGSLLAGDLVEFQQVSRRVGDKTIAVATLARDCRQSRSGCHPTSAALLSFRCLGRLAADEAAWAISRGTCA